jgi:hypothetical protein
MTNYLAGTCYLAFLLLAVISPFLQLRWMGRSISFALVALVGGRLLEGPTHWSNQNVGYAIGMALLWLFVCIIFAGLVVRVCIAA